MIDFIGLGAQKSGTSWLYACLYEHPEVCAPIKELHFFSRSRYENGIDWYESYFDSCPEGSVRGEFSTSYLVSADAPARIAQHYPNAKLVAIVRNPIDRAYSQYRNAIKTGELSETVSYESFLEQESSVQTQGLYHEQLQRYLQYFSRDQLLILVYEDIARDPAAVVRAVYAHLGVDPEFTPSQLAAHINVARTPRSLWLEQLMHRTAEALRKMGLDTLVWRIKTSGLTDRIRAINTKDTPADGPSEATQAALREYFRADAEQLSELLGRDLVSEWKL